MDQILLLNWWTPELTKLTALACENFPLSADQWAVFMLPRKLTNNSENEKVMFCTTSATNYSVVKFSKIIVACDDLPATGISCHILAVLKCANVFDFFQPSLVRRRADCAAFWKMQNALTRPSPPLIISSLDKRYIIVQYLEKYAILLLARIMYRNILADKKDPFLKFLSIWS